MDPIESLFDETEETEDASYSDQYQSACGLTTEGYCIGDCEACKIYEVEE